MSDRLQFTFELLAPASMEFLSNLNRFHAGQLTRDEYMAVIEKRSQSMEGARSFILNKVPISAIPAAAERQRKCIQVLNDAMNDLATVVPQLLEYGDNKTEEKYQELVVRLGRILSVERQTIDHFEMAECEVSGPTDMPLVNAVYRALKRFYAQEIPEAAYVLSIDKAVDKFRRAYDEMEKREDDGSEYKSDLLYAYSQAIEALEAVKSSIPEGEDNALFLMQTVSEKTKKIRECLSNFSKHTLVQGPTRMYQANYVYNMAKFWQQGRLETPAFLRMLDIFADNLDATVRRIQALAALPNDREQEIDAQVEVMQEGFLEQFRSVDLFKQGAAGNEEAMEQAFALLVSGAEKTADTSVKLVGMGDELNNVACMQCGTLNPKGSRKCSSCGARLLNTMENLGFNSSTVSYSEEGGFGSENEELRVTPELGRLFTAIDAATEGRIPKDQFASEIALYRQFVDNTFNADLMSEYMLTHFEDPNKDLPQRVEEMCGEMKAAAQTIYEALDALNLYVGETNSHHIVNGVLGLKEGNIRMQKVGAVIKAACKSADSDSAWDPSMSGLDLMMDDSGSGIGFVG